MSYTNPYYPNYMPPYQPPMQDRLAQLQNQYQPMPQPYQMAQMQPQQMVRQMQLSGQVVDSIDVVKAKDVDMSGAVTYYPKADMSEIYTKQLQADGTSRILTYRITQDAPQETVSQVPVTMDNINSLFGQLRADVLNEINGIKEMLPAKASPAKTRGGNAD